jgi:hypothetical protein
MLEKGIVTSLLILRLKNFPIKNPLTWRKNEVKKLRQGRSYTQGTKEVHFKETGKAFATSINVYRCQKKHICILVNHKRFTTANRQMQHTLACYGETRADGMAQAVSKSTSLARVRP